MSQSLERSGREQRRASGVVGAIVAVARTVKADEAHRTPELVAEAGRPWAIDEVTGRGVAVDRQRDGCAERDGPADRRPIREAQMEVAGLQVKAGGDGRQRREPLAIEQPTGFVDDAEAAIVLDAAGPKLDAFALLDPESLHRRDMQPRDLHGASLSH